MRKVNAVLILRKSGFLDDSNDIHNFDTSKMNYDYLRKIVFVGDENSGKT